MTDILFTHSYFLRFDPKQWKAMQPYPPLGTIYAAAVLKEAGYKVRLFDPMFRNTPEELDLILKHKTPTFLVIYDDCFNYLTKMCLSNMRNAALRMTSIAKSYGVKVIIASSDASDHFDLYLNQGADFVIRGEAEITLKELITALSTHKTADISRIAGIAYHQEGQTYLTPKRPVLNELDTLPGPAWELVDIESYKQKWLRHHDYFSLNMVTTRGCPYKCNWCAKPIYGNRYNSHAPDRIAEQLEYLIQNFAPDHIWFCDDIFGLKPGWVEEFMENIKKRNLKFRFKIQSRADLLIRDETVRSLASSGCESVWLGAESGSQKVLDAMEKGITVEEIYKATRTLKSAGIKPSLFLQFGYPDEHIQDIKQTIKMVHDLLPQDIGISVAYPLPGTRFYERVKEDLKVKANWTDSDDLDLMFRNTYSPQFYKHLYNYIHKSFRKKQVSKYFWNRLKKKKDKTTLNPGYKRMMGYPYYYLMSTVEKIRIQKIAPHAGKGL